MTQEYTWPENIKELAKKVVVPASDSHKGQNGKLLIIGGSELFHAASKWSLDVASEIVDMVFYASVPSNNELIQQAKGQFWNGIVITMDQINDYAEEADCILIGPGMTRTPDTEEIVNSLIERFPNKKMVIDAGALQMLDPQLLNDKHIITPHMKEFSMVYSKVNKNWTEESTAHELNQNIKDASKTLGGATILLKGEKDFIVQEVATDGDSFFEVIEGGHPGMTKGGTGDALAGLVAALYCKNDARVAATIASAVCKRAGEVLSQKVGPFFNASDLVKVIPEQLWNLISSASS